MYFPPTLLDLIYYLFTMQYVALFFVTNLISTLTKRANRFSVSTPDSRLTTLKLALNVVLCQLVS